MFSVKIFNKKENRTSEFKKTISTVMNYIFNKLNTENSKIISDSSCIEIISGKELIVKDNEIVVELLIRKSIEIMLREIQLK